ncbi:MAG: shikimate kinase [Lachnospiraceae bacterium]|nr:shikimate kinase [Lachnospiraceae bacterium]MBQ8632731.1 shikimate kinase [Lachnospiraceae bacterium]
MKPDKNRNIILIGYMGSGKSTVGRKAARAVEYNFLDTDALIEKEEGMTIAKLFEEKGEPYFREKETETIRKLIAEPKGNIIATGGGLPMKEGNAELLKELGTVIYLKAGTDTLLKRLSGDTARPLLKNGDLREKIETMLAIRGPVYEATADLVLQTDNMSFYEIICQIEKLLK